MDMHSPTYYARMEGMVLGFCIMLVVIAFILLVTKCTIQSIQDWQNDIGMWAAKTFPHSNTTQRMERIKQDIEKLEKTRREEWIDSQVVADIFMVLFHQLYSQRVPFEQILFTAYGHAQKSRGAHQNDAVTEQVKELK